MGVLHGYRFGQTRIWSEPGGGKAEAEETEKHVGEDLVNSWREVRSQRPLVWVERGKDLGWECLGTLGYETLVALRPEKEGIESWEKVRERACMRVI